MIEPMSAVTGELPSDDGRWAFEPKWDGMRAVVEVDHATVTAVSRTGKNLVVSFPELLDLADIADHVVLDGEVVASGDDGEVSFSRLQRRFGISDPSKVAIRSAEVPVRFVIFDLLELDGLEAWRLPFEQRRQLLERLIDDGPTWSLTESDVGGGAERLAAARLHGREGIMAKRLDAPYRPGRRSDTWRKVKIRHSQEFVVCGWTAGSGHRTSGVGALVLGCRQDDRWRWVGNVGTGLTSAESDRWRAQLDSAATTESPFGPLPSHPALRDVTWSTPAHVVQVAYSEWTQEGRLRQPSLLGRRDDVAASQVRCDE